MPDCIFCKIINKEIPCFKIYEDEHVLAFLDISPVAEDHFLIIPKKHAQKFHELSDEAATHLFLAAKKIITKLGLEEYNLLQNNGAAAGQVVNHVHLHILKRNCGEKLHVEWIKMQPEKSMESLKKRAEEMSEMINN